MEKYVFPFFGYGIPIVCATASAVLDFQPQEHPDAPNTPLIVVRDSFSCAPRLKTTTLELVLVQGYVLVEGW